MFKRSGEGGAKSQHIGMEMEMGGRSIDSKGTWCSLCFLIYSSISMFMVVLSCISRKKSKSDVTHYFRTVGDLESSPTIDDGEREREMG